MNCNSFSFLIISLFGFFFDEALGFSLVVVFQREETQLSNQAARVKKQTLTETFPQLIHSGLTKQRRQVHLTAYQSPPKDINASGSKNNRQCETSSLIKVTSQLIELGELLSS